MFSLIRGALIVGVIFYLSPLRGVDETGHQNGGPIPSPFAAEGHPAKDALWSQVVGSATDKVARTAVNETARAAGVRLKTQAAMVLAERPTPADNLRQPELDEAARNLATQGVRCVYRCDGSE